MNNIDYTLDIIGEKKTYHPREEFILPIINSNKKIFEITADNSYGKTFVLNLIAYALEADKLSDERILKSIKESIARYDDEKSYGLNYEIDLELPDNKKLSLSKSIGRGKIIQIDDGAPINHKILHRDLTVIYDVPTNPNERLNAVIKDLSVWNDNIKSKTINIAKYFSNLSKEFDSVRNEDKIEKLEKNSIAIKNNIADIEIRIKKKESWLYELEIYSNLKDLSLYLKKRLELETKLLKKQKAFKLLKKPSKIEKKDELKIKGLNNELAILEKDFKEVISKLIAEINKDTEIEELIVDDGLIVSYYDFIRNTEINDIIQSDDYVAMQKKFIESIEYIKDTIIRFISEKKNNKSYIIHNSYKELINLLEELVENEIDHFLKSATSVDSKKLKSSLETIINQHKVKDYDSLKSFLTTGLKPLGGYISQFMRVQSQLNKENKKKLVDDDGSKYYKIEAELKDLKHTLKSVKNNFDLTCATCANDLKILDLSRFDSLDKVSAIQYNVKQKISNPQLLENLNASKTEIQRKLRDLREKIKNLDSDKRLNERALEMERAKKTSRYNDAQKNKIKSFLHTISLINVNLRSYADLISKIEGGNLSEFTAQEDVKFMELAGKIIAYSMDNKLLRADGDFVNLEFYDMIKQEFHCENDIIIKKDDVSTGLASANYLKQRIENVEGKYVVILLDEIGNMAQNALDSVIKSIKKIEDQNRLVMAVFTRPNSKGIKIIEY
ncbi:hypothetical protein KO504_14200 [Winogradskyella psychrotolerans]|uniref:hypothetical protein n=1 Tax=Winogradskyella psychrotolerans TaxID=1344585 RepID=UPI001C069CCC|nr:hypothetical protein [Winogradskyella psychrotolerans]MBU2922496.1 hypothetical protein [Winogradskyella psychrotolerans]